MNARQPSSQSARAAQTARAPAHRSVGRHFGTTDDFFAGFVELANRANRAVAEATGGELHNLDELNFLAAYRRCAPEQQDVIFKIAQLLVRAQVLAKTQGAAA